MGNEQSWLTLTAISSLPGAKRRPGGCSRLLKLIKSYVGSEIKAIRREAAIALSCSGGVRSDRPVYPTPVSRATGV